MEVFVLERICTVDNFGLRGCARLEKSVSRDLSANTMFFKNHAG